VTRAEKRARQIVECNVDALFYLYDRWNDKSKHDGTDAYEAVIQWLIGRPVQLTTHPWGFRFEVDGELFALLMNPLLNCLELHRR
jgi:hypothetical protein